MVNKNTPRLCPFCGDRLYSTDVRNEYVHAITNDCVLSGFRVKNIDLWNKRRAVKSNLQNKRYYLVNPYYLTHRKDELEDGKGEGE